MNSGAFPLPKSYGGNFSAPLFPLYDLTLTGTGGWGVMHPPMSFSEMATEALGGSG